MIERKRQSRLPLGKMKFPQYYFWTMAILHIICGLPGAGKTTLAKKLEKENSAVRLCPDEWIQNILPPNYSIEERDRLRDPVENLQWKLTERLLRLGTNVILEWGVWGKDERAILRDKARTLGAKVKLHFLDVPLKELLQRVENRNNNLPDGSFHVSAKDSKSWHDLFQKPDEEELATFD